MMDLLNLLLGVFKCNHMYYIKDFFSIHFSVQFAFFKKKNSSGLLCCINIALIIKKWLQET